ncbi:HAD family hydrolase [Kitasatospora sp. DSM 101779]|uniref:HAD family hydrolase n=1 Tax=Kitasatospora sp. DSM 101779 TaxID=2853165 RepID=UPI0021DB150E|nr:HAD-IA family hydrolase [Kitasatospora sp. DSM 101779]MCU7823498.1 HAD-IA family hydrolase [Kitasatospora sp. DSM 101779]
MTAASPSLAELLRPVKHVLLDFDGPVCSVFAGLPAPEVARRLRESLLATGEQVPASGETETDPLALFRLVADTRPDLAAATDQKLTILETEAVLIGRPNAGGEAVLRACAETGRALSIVSNNSGPAIEAYISSRGLSTYVSGVFGRAPGDPSSMKPSPRLLLDAMKATASKPAECVFIGDAARDVEAGHAAGVSTIGYANKPGKDARLATAGAAAVVDSMHVIAKALS